MDHIPSSDLLRACLDISVYEFPPSHGGTTWTVAFSFLRFLDHIRRRTTFGRTAGGRVISSSRWLLLDNTQYSQQTNILAPAGLFSFCKMKLYFHYWYRMFTWLLSVIQSVYSMYDVGVALCVSSVTLSHLGEMIDLWSAGWPGFRSVRNVIPGCRQSISYASSSQVVFGVCPYFAPSSALGAESPHNLVGRCGCHIVFDSKQDVLVSRELLAISARVSCES